MTTRETQAKKEKITKKRALNRLIALDEIKKKNDWETIARKLYEILQDVDLNSKIDIKSKLTEVFTSKKINSSAGRKPSSLPWSTKDVWVPYCISIKGKYNLKSNIAAARYAIDLVCKKGNLKIAASKAESIAINTAKRMSERIKKIRN
jgi:G:T/U-mismatch repair DNA glycosylase